jgi:hypothetical protein
MTHHFKVQDSRTLTALTILRVCGFLSLVACAPASPVVLAWNPSPDTNALGYFIRIGKATGSYSIRIDALSNTTFAVSNLTVGKKYYAAVTAYDSALVESIPSNEVSFIVPAETTPNIVAHLTCLVLPDQSVMLSWHGVIGQHYQLDYALSSQPTNWLPLSPPFFAQSTDCRILDPQPITLSRRYRLQILSQNQIQTASEISFAP